MTNFGTVCSCHVQIGSKWLETPETEVLVSRADLLVSIAVVGSSARERLAQPRASPAEKGLAPAPRERLASLKSSALLVRASGSQAV